jgi:hypothetical protein
MAEIVKVAYADETGKAKRRTVIKGANASLIWSSDTEICLKISDYGFSDTYYEIVIPRSALT